MDWRILVLTRELRAKCGRRHHGSTNADVLNSMSRDAYEFL